MAGQNHHPAVGKQNRPASWAGPWTVQAVFTTAAAMAGNGAGDGAPESGRDGFTLIELVLSLMLAALLVAIAGMGLVMGTQGYIFARHNVSLAQKAELALARLALELRAMTAVVVHSGDVNVPYLIYDTADGRRAMAVEVVNLASGGRAKEIRLCLLADGASSLANAAKHTLTDQVVNSGGSVTIVLQQADPNQAGQYQDWTCQLQNGECTNYADLQKVIITMNLLNPGVDGGGSTFELTVHPTGGK